MKILRKIMAILTTICRMLGFVSNAPAHNRPPCPKEVPPKAEATATDEDETDDEADGGSPV